MNLLFKKLQKKSQKDAIKELNKTLEFVTVCPSKGRANNVLTKKLLPDIVLIVSETEYDEYVKNNPEQLVLSTPKTVKGITPTRQWILDNFKNVFMIDDDVTEVRRMYAESGEPAKITEPDLVEEIIYFAFYCAKKVGAKMFGFRNYPNPLEYYAFRPFEFNGYFNASYCGFIEGHGLKYDTTFSEGEDFYISLLNAYKNRFAFMETRFYFATKDNFCSKGGCADYRTSESIKKNTLRLQELFGNAIALKQPKNTKQNVNEGERKISIPF